MKGRSVSVARHDSRWSIVRDLYLAKSDSSLDDMLLLSTWSPRASNLICRSSLSYSLDCGNYLLVLLIGDHLLEWIFVSALPFIYFKFEHSLIWARSTPVWTSANTFDTCLSFSCSCRNMALSTFTRVSSSCSSNWVVLCCWVPNL